MPSHSAMVPCKERKNNKNSLSTLQKFRFIVFCGRDDNLAVDLGVPCGQAFAVSPRPDMSGLRAFHSILNAIGTAQYS